MNCCSYCDAPAISCATIQDRAPLTEATSRVVIVRFCKGHQWCLPDDLIAHGSINSPIPELTPIEASRDRLVSRGVPSGDICANCGGNMRRTGSCLTCESCGENTGCG